jgi:hypothetical protein
MRSKTLWGDPDNFRPERFLGLDGKLNGKEEFIGISWGHGKQAMEQLKCSLQCGLLCNFLSAIKAGDLVLESHLQGQLFSCTFRTSFTTLHLVESLAKMSLQLIPFLE